MSWLQKVRHLRGLLGRSCHAGMVVSMRMKSRELHGCRHDAGEDESGAKEGDGAQQNEKTAEQTGSSEKAKPVVSAGTWGCTSVWVIKP